MFLWWQIKILIPFKEKIMAQYINRVGYGLTEALPLLAPYPIKANRIPNSADKNYPVGQIWVYTATNSPYILTSVVSNAANWQLLSINGGAGVFTSLVVVGATTLTGTTLINVSGAANTTIGGVLNTGTVSIGGINSSGVSILAPALVLDSTPAGNIKVGQSITTGSIQIGEALTTGSIAIGRNANTNALALNAGSGGVNINSSGIATIDALSDIVASPAVTAVINANVGYATFTGFTTAAAATEVFTITNNKVTAASSILISANNLGANDAQMTVTRVLPGVGTFDVTVTNFGTAALNGDINLTFWVLN